MTTPGSVAAQIPTRVAPVGARDSGAKGDAPADDGDSGFGDVMNKLEQGDGGASKDVGQRRTSGSTERTHVRAQGEPEQTARKADSAETDFTADFLAEVDLAPSSDETAGDTVVPARQATAADMLGLSAIAAAVLNAQQTPASSGADTQQPQPDRSAPIVADTIDDLVNAAASVGDAATTTDRFGTTGPLPGAPEPSTADSMAAAGADMELQPAQLAASVAPAMPQRNEQPGQTKRTAASVLRQEAHFAPATSPTAGPRPLAAHDDTTQLGQGPEPLAADQAAETPLGGILTSADDLPSAMTRPSQQVADQIVSDAGTGPEFIERLTSLADQTGSKPTLKILHIQLQPIDLGTVTIRMELKDQELTLHVEADRSDTAEMIRGDQDTLANLLRGAGYSIDSASVRISDGGTSGQQVSQTSTGTSVQSQAQSQSGPFEQQRQGQGNGQRGSASGDTNPQISRNDPNETANIRSSGGVYI